MRDRRRPSPRLLAVAVALPLLVSGLAACSGADRADAPARSSSVSDAAAGASTSPTGSGTHRASPRPAGPLTAKTFVPALKAAVEQHPSAVMRMTLSGNGQSLRASGSMRFTRDPAAAIRISGEMLGNGVMELRVVDGSTYLSMPPLTPVGKFVKSGVDDKNGLLGSGLGEITGRMDPRKSFSAFGHGLRKVDYLGKESVGGAQLSHYRLTVDTKAAAAKAYGSSGLLTQMPETMRYDVWLDQRTLVRKLTFDLAGQASLVATWSRWGEPVSVSAPPKSDIIGSPVR